MNLIRFDIKVYPMVIMDTLFDVISATIGAVVGAMFAFFLNRKRSRQMIRQTANSRQELLALRQENERLLQQIKTKEDIILKMQMQMLGDTGGKKTKKSKKTKNTRLNSGVFLLCYKVKTPMLHEMLQFEMPINPYKIVLGYNVTQLKGNTTPLTA